MKRRTKQRRRALRPIGAFAALLIAATGWAVFDREIAVDGATTPGQAVLLPSTPTEVAAAHDQLDRLAVQARPGKVPEYRRKHFGDAWVDTDGNGCNQRDDVLLRDVDKTKAYTAAQQNRCDHDMLAGTWLDPYTGTAITLTDAKQPDQAQAVQIDHIVALSAAWRYGAHRWSEDERITFANDLRNLVAVSGEANQAKGSSDASQWQPGEAAQCGYAVRYITVKHAYRLPTDTAEKAALARMLGRCETTG